MKLIVRFCPQAMNGYWWVFLSLFACWPQMTRGEETHLAAVVEKLATPFVDNEVAVGLAVGVLQEDIGHHFGFGQLSRESDQAPDQNTSFEIGSISKVFTSLCLARMATNGKLSLDDAVVQHLPATIDVKPGEGTPISLLDLATHHSGLPRVPLNMLATGKARDNPYVDYDETKLSEFLKGWPLTRGDNTAYAYSNLGAGLLGWLLAHANETDYDTMVEQLVCRPLYLKNTTVTLSAEQQSRLAQGHSGDGIAVGNWDFDALAGAGAIRSTTHDLIKFARAQLYPRSTSLCEPILLAQRGRFKLKGGGQIGLGWHISPNETTIWHNGQTGGYHSYLAIDRQQRVAVAVLANSATMEIDKLGEALLKYVLVGKTEAIEFRKPTPVQAEDLEKLVGRYQLAPFFFFTITREGDKLFAKLTGQPSVRVYPESELKFFYRVVDAQLTFVSDDDGNVKELVLHQHGRDARATRVKQKGEDD